MTGTHVHKEFHYEVAISRSLASLCSGVSEAVLARAARLVLSSILRLLNLRSFAQLFQQLGLLSRALFYVYSITFDLRDRELFSEQSVNSGNGPWDKLS